MVPGNYDYTFAHLRKIKAVRGAGVAFAVQQIKGDPGLGARRGPGLCANGNQDIRFPEPVICVFCSSVT